MGRWRLERDAEVLPQPGDLSIGIDAFRRDLRRTPLLPVLQQTGEQYRHVLYLESRRQPAELLKMQIRKRRDEVEVPGGFHFHFIEHPTLATCSFGPWPCWAICSIASYNSRFAPAGGGFLPPASM